MWIFGGKVAAVGVQLVQMSWGEKMPFGAAGGEVKS